MLSHCKISGVALAVALAADFSVPAFALPMPQPQHQGDIAYISGGIGLAEQHSLEAQAGNYTLAITNADPASAFTTGTRLVIKARNGQDVLRLARTGPLFYAKLPPGSYVIQAMNHGQRHVRDVTIAGGGATDVHLIWSQIG